MQKCECYAQATDPARLEMWKRIFPPDGRVPITCPVPVGRANLAGQEAPFYLIDFDRVSPEEKSRLIKEMAVKFNLQEEEVAKEMDRHGTPVKADSVTVAWCHLHSRAVM